MSNRKKIPPSRAPATDLVAAVDGLRIPGGCDTCDAEQEIIAHRWGRDIHSIAIRHDDWCPTYQRMKQRGLAL